MKELTFHRWYLPWVERWPDRLGYGDVGAGTSTYGEHTERLFRLASAAKQLGVQPGDRLAVIGREQPRLHGAVSRRLLGAVVLNPLNLRFAPRELEYVIADSGCKVVFVDHLFAEVIDGVRAAAGDREGGLIGDPIGDPPHDVALRGPHRRRRQRRTGRAGGGRPVPPHVHGWHDGSPQGRAPPDRAEILNAMHNRSFRMSGDGQSACAHSDVPRRVDGDHHEPAPGPGAGTHPAAVRRRKGARCDRGVRRDGDGRVPTMLGDDAQPSRLHAGAGSTLKIIGYGASPMPEPLLLEDARAVSQRRGGPGLRHDRGVCVADGADRRRPRPGRRCAALGRPICAGSPSVDPGRRRQRATPGRDRRGLRSRRQLHDRVLEEARGDRRGVRAPAGTTRATPATSTRRATCSSSTG